MTHNEEDSKTLNEEFSLRLSEHQKEMLEEKAKFEDVPMSKYLRLLIDEGCNPHQSLERINKEIEVLDNQLQEKHEEKKQIIETLEEEKENLEKYKEEIISLIAEVYRSGGHTRGRPYGDADVRHIKEGHVDRVINQIDNTDRYGDVYIRDREELHEVMLTTYKEEGYGEGEGEKYAEVVYEKFVERGVLSTV